MSMNNFNKSNLIKQLTEYNHLIARYQMAQLHFADKKAETTEKHTQAFREIENGLGKTIQIIENMGLQLDRVEVIYGVNIEFRLARWEKYKY